MRHSGTQKLWRTSRARSSTSSWRSTGTWNSRLVLPASGYSNSQANCWAVTVRAMLSSAGSLASMSSRTIQEIAARKATITVGIAVQAISSRVLPWIGSPSDSSPGLARQRQIA